MANDRFVNYVVSDLQEANRSPIDGYQHFPLLTLEEATENLIPLVPNLLKYVSEAKKECNRRTSLLTKDESAAIYLYSMPTVVFSHLNEVLRAENRDALKPWFAFLKLFMTALEKLPSTSNTVWRGVPGDASSIFADGDNHIWWGVNSCSMDLKVVENYLGETGTVFAINVIHGKDISAFSAFPDEEEIILMPGTHVSAKCRPLNRESRFFIVHLEENLSQSCICEWIKYEYRQNSRIERIMNPSKSFPIDQNYINLAIIEAKEQKQNEKKLLDAKLHNEIISAYEEIHGTKTKIEIKNMFEICKDSSKNILVLGRAGIGKTIFCRYVAYQWAIGAIWQQYQLVIFILLRNLTETRYPPLASGGRYSLIDLVKIEYCCHNLPVDEEKLFKEQLNKNEILWILDGYDEIIQSIPSHLKYLLEQLLKTPHHILTTRPYLNVLSYHAQLEIIGFTDNNIKEYVKQFFHQIEHDIDNASFQGEKLLSFLKCNPRISGSVHIPVNLEITCSLWCDTDWSETTMMTITAMYDKITEWLCRRHLEKQTYNVSNQMTKEDVYQYLRKELAFLESLAFHGMGSKCIILPPKLLRIASKESQCSLQHQPHLLNIGILKSCDYKAIGTCIEADKNHYFLHLSFQEHFAARYLVKGLNSTVTDRKKKVIDFIKTHKYDNRFELVFTFTSGLLTEWNDEQGVNIFWETLLGEPQDLVGLRHVQIVILCLEDSGCDTSIPKYSELIKSIIKWIHFSVCTEQDCLDPLLSTTLQRSPSLVNQKNILNTFESLCKNKKSRIRERTFTFISHLPISNPSSNLIQSHLDALNSKSSRVQRSAYYSLGRMGEKAATVEVIDRLLTLIGCTNYVLRSGAYYALFRMGEKATTRQVFQRLRTLLDDTHYEVTLSASYALRRMTKKAPTNVIINRLIVLLDHMIYDVRHGACDALGEMSEKVATNEVITTLLILLDDENDDVSSSACNALRTIGVKAAINKMIHKLVILLDDTKNDVINNACYAVGRMGENAAIREVITRLLVLLDEPNEYVRRSACNALRAMGEKAATSEVIKKLLILLDDTNDDVRISACYAVGRMGENAATNEVITKLLILLDDPNGSISRSACDALRTMGEKAATNEVITKLLILLDDPNEYVSRSACDALRTIGGNTAIREVINRLLVLLDDTNEQMMWRASDILENMGEKAATSEVFNKLLILLDDTNDDVRSNTCSVLRKMAGSATTNEVINKLLILVGDANDDVRSNACEALESMSEKVAIDEGINRLLILLSNTNDDVKRSACHILRIMGEKAATNEVINRLAILLDDAHDLVKHSACDTLATIGERAATNEVISRILILLRDKNELIRDKAWETLAKICKTVTINEVINHLSILLCDINNDHNRENGFDTVKTIDQKAATNEVIRVLLDACHHEEPTVSFWINSTIGKIFDSLLYMPYLTDETVCRLWNYIKQSNCWFLENISPVKFINAFLETEISSWLCIIRKLVIMQGYAISISEKTIMVYGPREPVTLCVQDGKLLQQLKNASFNLVDTPFDDMDDAEWVRARV